MVTYLLHQSAEYNVGKRKPLVIICPGGGYAFTSDREAEVIALKFNSIGMNAVVLWYSTNDVVKNIPQNALYELLQAVSIVRNNVDSWLLDENNIWVCGFSAGGHLALNGAVKSTNHLIAQKLGVSLSDIKINGVILGYPCVYQEQSFEEDDLGFASGLITYPQTANERFFGTKKPTKEDIEQFNLLNDITPETPPMFIWHTYEDQLVDVMNAIKLSYTLRKNNVPFEMHIFEKGEHGLSLADRTTARKPSHYNSHVAKWFELCEEWLSNYIDNERERG